MLCGFVLAWWFAWLVWLCVREWLGGFGACCVFALVFPLFASRFISLLLLLSLFLLSLLVLLSSACPLACLVCSCVFVGVVSFSLSDKTKKSAFVLRSFFTWFWCLYFKLSKAIIASL